MEQHINQRINEAITFAVEAHGDQRRKVMNTPYILHPMEVASIIAGMKDDEDLVIAAVLHDCVEDTPVSLEQIREKFGDRVAAIVGRETENKREDLPPSESWLIRKQESLEILKNADVDVKMLWLGDKLSNMRSFYRGHRKIGDRLWTKTNQKDPKMQKWLYTTIRDYLKEDLSMYPAWEEYSWLCDQIFKNVE